MSRLLLSGLLGAGLLQVRAGLARIGLAAQAMEVLATQAPVRVAVATAQAVLVVASGLGIVLALFVQPAQVVGAGILVAAAPGGLEVLQGQVVVRFLLEQQLGHAIQFISTGAERERFVLKGEWL